MVIRRPIARLTLAAAAVGLTHCGAKTGLQSEAAPGISGGWPGTAGDTNAAGADSGGGTTTGGVGAAGASAASGCTGSLEEIQISTGLCVSKAVQVTNSVGFAGYTIDATEVTRGQYDEWLATHPSIPNSSDPNCGYVTSYVEQGSSDVYSGPDAEHHPVVYVDWCDARDYCAAVGKRLCGAVGGATNPFAAYADANQSQWYRACTSGGANEFPYGNSYQPGFCDGYDYWSDTNVQTVAVGSLSFCVTSTAGYAGVYDLSGNVWEWEDSCDGPGSYANCHVRGGADYSLEQYLACGYDNFNYRISVGSNFGFRCCSY